MNTYNQGLMDKSAFPIGYIEPTSSPGRFSLALEVAQNARDLGMGMPKTL